MIKKIVGLVVVVVLVAGGAFVYKNLGGWARIEAQRVASEAAGVDVSIGDLNVSFRDKVIQVKDIKVANPQGFGLGKAITLGDIKVHAEQISRDKLVIKEVVATGEIINLHMKDDKINLRELLNAMQARNATKPTKTPSESDIKAPKVVIKELRIEKGTLNSSLDVLGKKTEKTLTIPTIRMNNLGEGKAQNNASQVVAQILQEIITKSIQTASTTGLLQGLTKDSLKAPLKDSITDLKGKLFK